MIATLEQTRAAIETIERLWRTSYQNAPPARTLAANAEGVFLGATKLASQIEGNEERIHALVSYMAGVLAPASLGKTLAAAKDDYNSGEKARSAMRLALALPTPRTDEESCRKLHLAAGLIERGLLSPGGLLAIANLRDDSSDRQCKYSPDEPRVPAGNSGGGQWTRGDTGAPAQGKETKPPSSGRQVAVAMPEGCDSEWAWAVQYCNQLLAASSPSRSLTGGHATTLGCAKGFVSERCGGNAISKGQNYVA